MPNNAISYEPVSAEVQALCGFDPYRAFEAWCEKEGYVLDHGVGDEESLAKTMEAVVAYYQDGQGERQTLTLGLNL